MSAGDLYSATAECRPAANLHFLKSPGLKTSMRELSTNDCKHYLEQAATPPLLLDVREPWEYNIVHLEHSRLIPMREIPQAAEAMNPEQEIIVICHHGIRSRQVALYLESKGFTNVINLSGGLDAWARDTDRQMPSY